MLTTVYSETSIPSFYYEIRSAVDMVARRDWTRQWWGNWHGKYDLVTSAAVIEELHQGQHPMKADALSLVDEVPLLPISQEVMGIVEHYIAQRLMPKDVRGDTRHLAVASLHGCHYLLTWNCAHLANANKTEHIRHMYNMLGRYVPVSQHPWNCLACGTLYEIPAAIRGSLDQQAEWHTRGTAKRIMTMKLYLDMCAIVNSEALILENAYNKKLARRERVALMLQNFGKPVVVTTRDMHRAATLRTIGFGNMDALHIACAEHANADAFGTCDCALIARARRREVRLNVSVINPIDLVREHSL